MLNKIMIMGRLTRDPEIRMTQNGTAVVSFTIACDRDRKDQDGGKQTDFVDCVAWRSTAEFVAKYFVKGRMAIVDGRLQLRDWTDNSGNKRRATEIVADSVYFGDSKKDANQAGAGGYGQQPTAYAGTGQADNYPVIMDAGDDELPF